MAEPYKVNACVKEIRKSTFGLDMRKPLADGLEAVVRYYNDEGIRIEGVMTEASLTSLHDDYYRLVIQT